MSDCTRLEVRYALSTMDYFGFDSRFSARVLGLDEKEYLQSLDFFTVDDPERIKAFAHDMSLGSYDGLHLWGTFRTNQFVSVDCYRDNEHVMSFMVLGNLILTKDRRRFKYPKGLPDVKTIEPAEIQPFKLRLQCALHMQEFYGAGPLDRGKKVTSYPEPTEWCDVIMRDGVKNIWMSEEEMTGYFKCPTAGEAKYHYAMNPHCEPNSPPDTVLLFETEGGWNQHGGPELFTFDHHEPRGGCVLLNDATVRFIRTEEELKQLRWK